MGDPRVLRARARAALIVAGALAAAGAGCAASGTLGAQTAQRTPRFTAATPTRGLALTLPFGPSAWELTLLDARSVAARTLPGATTLEAGRTPVPVPRMACTFELAPAGQSVEQVAASWHPDTPRYNERAAQAPQARIFSAQHATGSGADRRVGVVRLPSGRVAIGECLLVAAPATPSGAEAFAFYDEVLLGVTDDRGVVAGAQSQIRTDPAALLRERHQVPVRGEGFAEGTSVGLPGPREAWTITPTPRGFEARSDAARLGASVRCVAEGAAGADLAAALAAASQGARGASVLETRRDVSVGERTGLSTTLLEDDTALETIAWVGPTERGQLTMRCTGPALERAREAFDVALATSVLSPSPRATIAARRPTPAPEPLPPEQPEPPIAPPRPAPLEIPAPNPATVSSNTSSGGGGRGSSRRRRRGGRRGGTNATRRHR